MKFRKDDPIYYQKALQKLIEQAFREGLAIQMDIFKNNSDNEVRIGFKAENGDLAQVCMKPTQLNER